MQKEWRSIKKAVTDRFVPNAESIKQQLWNKIREQMNFEDVPNSLKADRVMQQICAVARLLSRHAPAKGVALLRLLFNGMAFPKS
eukprot:1554607-Amphidinium_carterae.2